jgi:C4-dicarboxylate transporter DctQ subunit
MAPGSGFSRALVRGETLLTGGCAAVALGIASHEMLARYLAPGLTKDWSLEMVIYLLVWATFLSGGALVRENRHISADVVVRMFGPAVQRALMIAAALAGLAFSALLCWFGVQMVEFAMSVGERSESTLRFPLWLFYLCLPVGMALTVLGYGAQLWRLVFAFHPSMLQGGHAPKPE